MTLDICFNWPSLYSATRFHCFKPGSAVSHTSRPPNWRCLSATETSNPRRASVSAASSPAGPPPTTSTRPELSFVTISGCQPRRHSSPAVGFCVHRTHTPSCQEEMHRLHPMHSRISASLPSSIFFGRNGSAIEGRAAPIRSSTPRLICPTMVSGEVKRPTPTTGLFVMLLTKSITGSWLPSGV